jgi:beta-lactam-binding protein with PASTA domain
VTYRVCAGPETVTIPDVRGGTEESARTQLEGLRLAVEVEEEDGPAGTAGQVRRTEPEVGTEVAVGDTVTIFVSLGNLVEVPDVVGEPEQTATIRLESEGFAVQRTPFSEPPESPDQVGTVARQDPEPDTEAKEGSTVTIFVYEEGAELQADHQVDEQTRTVTVSWDNDIYGDVTIDWGDGSSDEEGSAGETSHTYQAAAGAGPFTITIRSADPAHDREVTLGPVNFPEE